MLLLQLVIGVIEGCTGRFFVFCLWLFASNVLWDLSDRTSIHSEDIKNERNDHRRTNFTLQLYIRADTSSWFFDGMERGFVLLCSDVCTSRAL